MTQGNRARIDRATKIVLGLEYVALDERGQVLLLSFVDGQAVFTPDPEVDHFWDTYSGLVAAGWTWAGPGTYEPPYVPPEVQIAEAQVTCDMMVRQAIAQGFAFNGLVFSASLEAQSSWTNLAINADALEQQGAFPLYVNNKDDTGGMFFVDAAQVKAAYGTGFARIATCKQAGARAKETIRAGGAPVIAAVLAALAAELG